MPNGWYSFLVFFRLRLMSDSDQSRTDFRSSAGRLRSEGPNRPPSGIGYLQTLGDDRFGVDQRTNVSPPPTRSGSRAQFPHAASQLASQQGAQSHPVGVADPRGNLIDAFGAGAQQMHGTLDAQVLEVRQG